MTRTRNGSAVRFSTEREWTARSGNTAESVPPAVMSRTATEEVMRHTYCISCDRATKDFAEPDSRPSCKTDSAPPIVTVGGSSSDYTRRTAAFTGSRSGGDAPRAHVIERRNVRRSSDARQR